MMYSGMSPSHGHPIFARFYPHFSRAGEKRGADKHRGRLLAGLTGRVLEVGAGHGLNFSYYPREVTKVLAVEPEPHLRELARAAARRAPVSVEVTDGTAEKLPCDDGEFDAAVTSLVLCSVIDQDAALREIVRALRPGGELRFYEHVVSSHALAARLQQVLDATIYPALAGGCHCARDTTTAIRHAGFEIHHEQRITFRPSPLSPPIPHILGIARRP